MAGPVHESLIPSLVAFKEDMSSIHHTTFSERRAITFITSCRVPLHPNPSSSITSRGKHAEGLYTVPDAAFGYIDRRPGAASITAGCPRVVFEIAVSQTYESLLEDARQWLVRSKGLVVLCIIIKIYEEKRASLDGVRSELDKDRRDDHHPVHDSAEAASPAAPSSSSPSDNDFMASTEGRNQFLDSTSEHSRWVGKLTGFLELYRLSDDGSCIVQDGPRYVCHPHPNLL